MSNTDNLNLKNPIHLLAFGFGSGLAPKAPGTAGTIVAVFVYLPLSQLTTLYYAIALVMAFGLGVVICEKTSNDLGVHDHGGIVWDEFVGYWITMFMVPVSAVWIIVGFLLFRLFDILKPWPIKWADTKVEGGIGIMLDDVLAGIMAALCIQATMVLIS